MKKACIYLSLIALSFINSNVVFPQAVTQGTIDDKALANFKKKSSGKAHTAVVITAKMPSFAVVSYFADPTTLPSDFKAPTIPSTYVTPDKRQCVVSSIGVLPDESNVPADAFVRMVCADDSQNPVNLIMDKLSGTGELSTGKYDDLAKSFCDVVKCNYNSKDGYYEVQTTITQKMLKKFAKYISAKNVQHNQQLTEYTTRMQTFFDQSDSAQALSDTTTLLMKVFFTVNIATDYQQPVPATTQSYLNFYKDFTAQPNFTNITTGSVKDSECTITVAFSPRKTILEGDGTSCTIKNFSKVDISEYTNLMNFKYTKP